MEEQKIKQDAIAIGANIRKIRKQRGIGQTDLIRMLSFDDVSMTRETLVKIERGIQHIQATQLYGIRNVLGIEYEDLLSFDVEDRSDCFTLRINEVQLKKLGHLAANEKTTINKEITQLISQRIQEFEAKHGEIPMSPQE